MRLSITLGLFALIVLVSGCTQQEATLEKSQIDERLAELETKMTEMENDMSSMNETIHAEEQIEDSSLASMDQVTVWIDHFIIRRKSYSVGDKVSVHVHVRRRDKLEDIWDGTIKVSVGADVVERSVPLTNQGDDHHDYSFSAGRRGLGAVTVKAEISDDVGILDAKEDQIVVG